MRRCASLAIMAMILIGVCALAGCRTETWRVFDPWENEPGDRLAAPLAARELAADALRDAGDETRPMPQPIDGRLGLTIEDAAFMALANNADLRVQRLNPAIASTFEDIERGFFDPELFVLGEYFEDEAVELSRATGESFGVTRQDSAILGGIRQLLPTGTEVELGVGAGRNTSNRTPEQQNVRASLTLTQALLRGFGPAVNLARIRQAQFDTLASLYQLQGFAESLLADTERTYWQFALAMQRIRIFEESLALAQRQQDEVEGRIEIGVLAQTESATARAEVAQREQDLIDARSELDRLELQLLRLINPRSTIEPLAVEVAPLTEPDSIAVPLDDRHERIDLAILKRPELNEARLRLEQRRLDIIVTRNGLLPRLDFFITLGKTGYADAFSNAVREIDGPSYDLAAGVDFSYPLGNRTAEAQHEGALLRRRQAAESIDNLAQLVRLDVRLALVEVERARQQITATAATRALREEALRAENERFGVGESTSILIAQAQRDLLEAQINEVDAVIGYRLALIDLYLAEGTLLDRRGIVLDTPPPAQP